MEIQSSYFSYLFALGMGQSLMLILALSRSGLKKYVSRIFFLILLFIISLEILFGLLYQTQSIFTYPHFLRINTPFVLAIAPLLYLCIKHFLSNERSFRKKDLWHFLPLLLTFLYFLPLYFSSAAIKLDYLDIMFNHVHSDSLIFGGTRRVQQFIYLIATALLIKKDQSKLRSLLKNSYFRILFALTFLIAAMWVFDMYRILFNFEFYMGVINTVLMSSALIYLTIKLLSKEAIFQDNAPNKYASSGLSLNGEQEVLSKIQDLFKSQKAYTNQHLTLAGLASKLSMPSPYISQTINNQLGVSYNDFVNKHRVEEAQRLLQDSANHNLTLVYIAQSSGFKSSSAFNSAFKKVTGITPSEFRKNQI